MPHQHAMAELRLILRREVSYKEIHGALRGRVVETITYFKSRYRTETYVRQIHRSLMSTNKKTATAWVHVAQQHTQLWELKRGEMSVIRYNNKEDKLILLH